MNAPALARPASLRELFLTFTVLAVQGFGGVLAVAQRAVCDEKHWMTREQFVELLAICQVLPGPNACNLAILSGDRCFGWRGADRLVVRAFKAGLAPVAIALLVATAWILAVETPGRAHLLLTAGAALAVAFTRMHMLVLIGVGALAGALVRV